MTKSITTYRFPTTYEEGNWIHFNIYVQEHTRFNAGRYKAGGMRQGLKDEGIRSNPNIERTVLNGINFEPRPALPGGGFDEKEEWFLNEVNGSNMKKIETSIGLYLPENISFSYGIDWGQEELGLVRSLQGAISSMGSSVKSFKDDPSWSSFQSILDTAKNTLPGRDAAGLGVRMMAGMASIAGIPVNKLFDRHQKMVLNRHTELHFNGVNLRSFEFNFKFYPRNADEAKQIKAITDTFKFHMHPELSNNSTGLYMLYPSQFEIHFMRGWKTEDGKPASSTKNLNVAKVGRAALTDCTINHGEGEYVPIKGDGWSPSNLNDFHNSYTEMKLTFQELSVLTKKDILEGM